MILDPNTLPKLTASQGRKTAQGLSLEALKESGAFASSALNIGDTITFPPMEEMTAGYSEVRTDGPKAYSVGIIKNEKPAWLTIGTVRRRGANNEPLGKVSEKMNSSEFTNDYDRAVFLAGKTIKVTEKPTVKVAKYTEVGVRDGEEDKPVAFLEFM